MDAVANAIVRVANEASSDLLGLLVDEGGVRRGASATDSIAKFRVGEDARLGTGDDRAFIGRQELKPLEDVDPPCRRPDLYAVGGRSHGDVYAVGVEAWKL